MPSWLPEEEQLSPEALKRRLDAWTQNQTPANRARAERERSAFLPFDFLGWPPPQQLLFLLNRFRQFERIIGATLAPMVPGCEGWFATSDDLLVESSRVRLLLELEKNWQSGRLMHSLIGDSYALCLLLAGKDRYATVAERETAYFLRQLSVGSGAPLETLRELKGVSQSGFDGLFIGTVPALAIGTAKSKYIGLEVKTVVDMNSLTDRIGRMVRQWANKDVYREKNLEKAVELLEKKKSPLLKQVQGASANQVATLLVVRSCTMGQSLTLPPRTLELFDRVIAFNIFGTLIGPVCHGVNLPLLGHGVSRYNRERYLAWNEAIVAAGATAIARGRAR